jgi:N-acetylglucosamine-6-sulfatase
VSLRRTIVARPALIAALCLVAAVPAAVPASARPLRAPAPSKPNIVVILTDDQRWDEFAKMPTVQAQLVDKGVSFANSYVSNPLCCPSRATFLTGQTSGHNGVWWSTPRDPYGGFPAFLPPKDSSTLATWLHDGGYHTGLVGKYLNSYNLHNYTVVGHQGYVPPGWDTWYAWVEGNGRQQPPCEDGGYYNWCSFDGTNLVFHGTGVADYSTTIFSQHAVDFIAQSPQNKPLFLFYTPHAPHGPTQPDKKYKGTCADQQMPEPPSFNEQDVSDKPQYIQNLAKLDQAKINKKVKQWQDACSTLRSIDDSVGAILDELQATGRLNNTLILYASDNGLSYGEHRVLGKAVPYEESIRVPLIIRYDPVTGPVAGETADEQVVNLDYASTLTDAAGVVPGRSQDGLSLMPLVADPSATLARDGFVIEHHAVRDQVPDFCGVRDHNWMYAQYSDGEEELYDLNPSSQTYDPYQLQNQASNGAFSSALNTMRAKAHTLCDPPPPGWVWHH